MSQGHKRDCTHSNNIASTCSFFVACIHNALLFIYSYFWHLKKINNSRQEEGEQNIHSDVSLSITFRGVIARSIGRRQRREIITIIEYVIQLLSID